MCRLLIDTLDLIPVRHYLLALSIVADVSLYNLLEFHLLEDAISSFIGTGLGLKVHY